MNLTLRTGSYNRRSARSVASGTAPYPVGRNRLALSIISSPVGGTLPAQTPASLGKVEVVYCVEAGTEEEESGEEVGAV